MHRLARDGHCVVADALDAEVGMNYRRDQTQVSGARQVHANECVTHLVQGAADRVDPLVAENRGVGKLVVADQEGPRRRVQRVIDALGQEGHLLLDPGHVSLETIFVMTHRWQLRTARSDNN
jgi:hypothetical protein